MEKKIEKLGVFVPAEQKENLPNGPDAKSSPVETGRIWPVGQQANRAFSANPEENTRAAPLGRFEGWYFKHQSGTDTVAFIPGKAAGGAFVQMICEEGSRQFAVQGLSARHGLIRAGNCLFSRYGCKIKLPGVQGKLCYGPLTLLRSDIMGPFRFFPMECRHGIISMAHPLHGSIVLDGRRRSFDGGTGYIETDSGCSFPDRYLWLQCGDFEQPCSLMASVADIPFCGLHFTGCICAIVYGGREYRLATYRGVRILAAGPEQICLAQGSLRLDIRIHSPDRGHPLAAPCAGQMTGMIRECHNAAVECTLRRGEKQIFSLHSARASFEYHGPDG